MNNRRLLKNNEKPKNYKQNIKRLLSYIKPFRILIIIAFILAIISAISNVIIPTLLGNATDEIINSITINTKSTKLLGIIICAVIVIIICAICGIIEGLIMSKISKEIGFRLRKEINEKINKLPLSYFDLTNNGEILSFVTNDVDTITSNLSTSLTSIISSFILLIGSAIMMFIISVPMTLVILISIPICIIIMILFISKGQKHFDKYQKYLGYINSHIEESYSGQATIKLYNMEKNKIDKMHELNETLYESSWKSQFYSSSIQPILKFLGNFGYFVGCALGGYFIIKGKSLTIGKVQAFVQYAKTFNRPLSELSSLTGVFQQTISASERIFNYLDQPEEKDYINSNVELINIKGNIEFKNVNFGYNKNKTIINNFNLKIKPNQKIAIVGPTGAGKTTIVKLLMNYYDLIDGNIYLDRIDINDLSKEKLRNNIGMVLQDPWIFEGTIYENVAYGKKDCKKAEVEAALELANAKHFISTLPEGYNFKINESTNNISDGEKQLITIARTILNNPKILILDEATSAVDTRTEVLIQKAMINLMKDKTCFIIAHRLSTIKESDLIIVMNHGDVVETGTHNDLLKKQGFYYDMYNSQFGIIK